MGTRESRIADKKTFITCETIPTIDKILDAIFIISPFLSGIAFSKLIISYNSFDVNTSNFDLSGRREGHRGARTPFYKSRPRPPITPHTRQNSLGHRVSDFKFEVMLNKWSNYFWSRIPVKLNFDLTGS